jgi:hypothetical protein
MNDTAPPDPEVALTIVPIPESERVPDPPPENLPGGEVLVSGAGLRSSNFSFGFLDGWLVRGAVCDATVRGQWQRAGEEAAAQVHEQAARARAAAEGEHAQEVEGRRAQLEGARQELDAAAGKVPVMESQVEKASAQGRPVADVRRKLREQRDLVRDLTQYAQEAEGRLAAASRAQARAGREALEASYQQQHALAEGQRHQVEREVLEAIEPVARRWFVLFAAQQVCREEIRKITLDATTQPPRKE